MNNKDSTKKIPAEMLCLTLLKEKDMYGYEMTQEIFARSGGLLSIPEGLLYISMHRMTEKGYISDRKELVGARQSRVRVYYHIEPSGEQYLLELNKEYENMQNGISNFFAQCKHNEGDKQ